MLPGQPETAPQSRESGRSGAEVRARCARLLEEPCWWVGKR